MFYLRASLTVDGAPSIEGKENLASQLHAQFGCSIHVAHVITELVRSSAYSRILEVVFGQGRPERQVC